MSRYYGLHEMVCYKDGKKSFDVYIIIMNNIFLSPNINHINHLYDLKGSTFKRFTKMEKIQKGSAGKDINYI